MKGKKINVTVYHDDCVKFWVWSLKTSLKTYNDMQCGVHWLLFSLYLLIQVFLQLSTSCPWFLDNPSYDSFQCCVWNHLVVASLLTFFFLPLLFNAAWTFLGNVSPNSFKEVSGKDSQLSSTTVWNAAPIHDRTSDMFYSWLKTFRVVPLYSPPLYMLMTRWIKKMPKKIKIWIDQL